MTPEKRDELHFPSVFYGTEGKCETASGQPCKVGLAVEAGGAEVAEMTHLHTGHLQKSVAS
jgi:hypothetical protein